MTDTHPDTAAGSQGQPGGSRRVLVIGAIGVVFGDLGTSPLYTLKEAFHGRHGMAPEPAAILGVLSLIAWTLVIVVAVKYVGLVMRADNKGEGGIMALMALAQRAAKGAPRTRRAVVVLALLGAALFFGDGVVTPAISVLSAVEGLQVAAPALDAWVVPVTVLVLFGLFQLQRFGTGKVGAMFGPVMVLWFTCLGIIGLWNIWQAPGVLQALNPWYALHFFIAHGTASFVVLGAVVLCVTGVEALYTDMGHFGRTPIRVAWYGFVMPSLLLNYFGQGALLLHSPDAARNPFYLAVPDWGLYPMIGLATLATVIASQAFIAGAFTVTRHAIQLGFVPRMRVLQTSTEAIGQIYLPLVNNILMIAVIVTVIGFGSSAAMAGAYGIAVTGTMTIDTVLTMIVARRMWGWRRAAVIAVGLTFLAVELSFLGANTVKIPHGGWFPLILGVVMFIIMTTWRRGRTLVRRAVKAGSMALEPFLRSITDHPPHRISGTAFFLTSDTESVPHAMLHNLKHNKVLHERNILVNVEILETPVAAADERVIFTDLGHGFSVLQLQFGFAEDPDLPVALEHCRVLDPPFNGADSTFFISRDLLRAGFRSRNRKHGMPRWRERLFAFMARNALPATATLNIPGNRLIELGAQVEI